MVLAAAAFATWTTLVVGGWMHFFRMPGGFSARLALTYAVPALLGLAAALYRGQSRALLYGAGATAAVALALALPPIVGPKPILAWSVVALVVGGLLTQRRPRFGLIALFVVASAHGSIRAFTGIPVVEIGDGILAGFWFGVIGRLLIGRRPMSLRPSPALFLLGAYMVMTFGAILVTDPIGIGIRGFRVTHFHMSVMLLVGYGAFKLRTIDAVAKAFAIVCMLGGGYATLRWAIGPDPKEAAINYGYGARYNNTVGEESKVQGALFNGQGLAVWSSCAIPFLLAIAISWRGRYRLIALIGLPLSLVGMFGSGQRTIVPAVIAGCLTVILVHTISRSFPGPRLGIVLAAVVVLIFTASVAYPAVVDSPQKRQRYENILSPSEDVPFQERLIKWNQTLSDLKGQPFGFGIGKGVALFPNRFANVASDNIDNSYLMIAYEQGIAVMILFIVTLFVLLAELLRAAIWTRGTTAAALTTAGAGTLVSMMIELVTADQITSTPIVAGWMIVGLGIAQYGSRRDAVPAGQPA
jgi:hypothetical protein